jgi:HSP20 family protein
MKDLYTLHDRMGQVLGRMAAFREEKSQKGKSDWNPSLDFFETEDRFEVLVELPGVSQDDVNVSIAENQLVIKGKKQKEQTDETQNLHHSERRYGKFHRVFPLPPNAVADDIKAEFKDGVLKLVIPKTEAAKPTDIPISGDA